jgi:hypothetical protein
MYTKAHIKRDSAAARKVYETVGRRPQRDNDSQRSLPSANELKTKIRDVKRLLNHSDKDMPADMRIEKERELKGYQRDLEEVESRKKKSEMISKYHFVRFLGILFPGSLS